LSSIPRTRGLHLDEAMMRISCPVNGTAEYPVRSSSPTGLARTGSSDSATDGSGKPATPTPEAGPSGTTGGRKRHSERSAESQERKKGTISPKHSQTIKRYGGNNLPRLVKEFLVYDWSECSEKEKAQYFELLGGSLARSTWGRYSAALKTWKCFAEETENDWKRVSDSRRGKFIGWCRTKGKLSAASVKIYLGELKRLAEMRRQLRRGGGSLSKKNC
jgi:hypothetical protein